MKIIEFRYREDFLNYGEHIVASWFLRATKLELLSQVNSRQHVLVINSDFGENILVVSKHETSDQFFHRLEICLFGSVCLLARPEDENVKSYDVSYIVTSDYKYESLNILSGVAIYIISG